jgi:uncharacterized protein YcnI
LPVDPAGLQNPHAPRRRWPLAVLATAVALALPAAALAHVTIAPSYVDLNTPATITFETPNERAPHTTVSLTIDAPPGVALSRAAPPPGWKLDLTTTHARWSGGQIGGTTTVGFPVRVLARTRLGDQVFRAVQVYDDGRQVRWPATLSVLPARGAEASSGDTARTLAAGGAALLVVVGSALVVWRLRRRPLQEK